MPEQTSTANTRSTVDGRDAADTLDIADAVDVVAAEINRVLGKVSRVDIDALVERLAGARRVFVAGEGRSGLMGKAFAMRLMHLGFTVYAVGETITPSLAAGDTVVVISGSGTTPGAVRTAQTARAVGAAVHAVSTDPDSTLGGVADQVLTLPAATKYRRPDEAPTVQPLSSLFDQVTHIVLDVVCLRLARRREVDNAAARGAHANTE